MPHETLPGFMLGSPPRTEAATEPAPDLTEDDLRVLLADDAAPAGGERKPEAAQDQDDEDSTDDEEAASPAEELAQLKQDLARTQGALAVAMRGTQPGSGTGQHDPIKAFSQRFFGDRYKEIPEETRAFFEDYGKGLVELVTTGIGQRLQGIEQALQASSGKQVLDDFETQLETVMQRAGLTDSEQEIFKESVMFDGLRRYGNGFTTEQAVRLFRAKHQKYLNARQNRQQQDEQELDEQQTTTSPATRRGGNLVARDDVVGKLMRSTERDNNFGGRNWRQHIARRLKQAASGGA